MPIESRAHISQEGGDMTNKKAAARLGREIRKATGIPFPAAMRLARLAVRASGGGYAVSHHHLGLVEAEDEARAILAACEGCGMELRWVPHGDTLDASDGEYLVTLWGPRGELS